MSLVEAQGIIGSIAFSFDGDRLRLVWIPPSNYILDEIAKGARFTTKVLDGYLEMRRFRGKTSTIRARARKGYHRNKGKKRDLRLGSLQERDQATH